MISDLFSIRGEGTDDDDCNDRKEYYHYWLRGEKLVVLLECFALKYFSLSKSAKQADSKNLKTFSLRKTLNVAC